MQTTDATEVVAKTGPFDKVVAFIILALIIYLVYCKKKRLNPIKPLINLVKNHRDKPGRNVEITTTDRVPPVKSSIRNKNPWYGDYYKLITINKFQKVVNKEYVVFDLETTGLNADHDKIVEIGAVKVRNGKIVDQYQQLVNPGIHIPMEASEKNHITDNMVKKAPNIKEALPEFLDFVDGKILTAHNAGFDASFLDKACREYGMAEPKEYFDTMRLNVYWPGLKNRKLATFLEAAGIENNEAHRALSDAEATAKLIMASMAKIS